MEGLSFPHFIWVAFCAGIIGTIGMELMLQSITKFGIANADMTRAIGSLFTNSSSVAYRFGFIIQSVSGIVFAFIYVLAFELFDIRGILNSAGAGLLLGFIHGAVVGFILVTAIAENHPHPEFRKAEFPVAVAHWAGHLIYGLLVGVLINLIGI